MLENPLFTKVLKFRGAFPYPVAIKNLTIFRERRKFSVSLNEKESILLLDYMQENKIKSKAEAIRKCIRTTVNLESKYDLLLDINNKLNRILYRENIQKKLLEQIYANMEFLVDKDIKTEKGLQRFYQNNNFYKSKIMD